MPVELFQILKDDAVKVLHSICQQIWKTQQWHKTGKGQFSFQFQRRAMPKNVQTSTQLHSSHTLAKLMLKILQARLQHYVNREYPDVHAGFSAGRLGGLVFPSLEEFSTVGCDPPSQSLA